MKDEELIKEKANSKIKQKASKKSGVFSINTSYSRSELELLQHVIYTNSFRETSIGGDMYWFALALNFKDFKRVAKNKFFWNRYPMMEFMARKKVFCSVTNRMRKTFDKQFGFSPISFLLPEEAGPLEAYME
jgi:hypothetical protein